MLAMQSDAATARSAAGGDERVAVEVKPLCPGRYGERTVQCQGILVEMKNGTGWVQPLQAIDHPNAHWNRGKVYLAQRDMRRPGQALRPGDLMVFYLYADSKGLGAEDCFPLRDPSAKNEEAEAVAEALETAEKPWKQNTKSWEPWQSKSWQPWWARGGDGTWSNEKKESSWWRTENNQYKGPWSYPTATTASMYQANIWAPPSEARSEGDQEDIVKPGYFSDEVTTKIGSSLSGANSTCSGSDEDETKASRDGESSEELDGITSSTPPSPTSGTKIPFMPPPGLELPVPSRPPPGLPHPAVAHSAPLDVEAPQPRQCKTISLVEMLPE